MDHVDPRLLAVGRRVLLEAQRHVGEPAGLGRREEHRRVQREAAEQVHPVRPRVQAREGDVARADHQREQVVREARPHRHDDQEDHRRAVHGEDLVVPLRRQQRVVRDRQLRAHQQRLDPAQHEEHQDGDEVHDPDLLVIGGGDPRRPAAGLALHARGDDLRARERAHPLVPRSSASVWSSLLLRAPSAASARAFLGGLELLHLVGVPAPVVRHPHADHAGVHVGVVAAAELGALAGEDHLRLRPRGSRPAGSGTTSCSRSRGRRPSCRRAWESTMSG